MALLIVSCVEVWLEDDSTEHIAGSQEDTSPGLQQGGRKWEQAEEDTEWLGACSRNDPQSCPESGWPGLEAPACDSDRTWAWGGLAC